MNQKDNDFLNKIINKIAFTNFISSNKNLKNISFKNFNIEGYIYNETSSKLSINLSIITKNDKKYVFSIVQKNGNQLEFVDNTLGSFNKEFEKNVIKLKSGNFSETIDLLDKL